MTAYMIHSPALGAYNETSCPLRTRTEVYRTCWNGLDVEIWPVNSSIGAAKAEIERIVSPSSEISRLEPTRAESWRRPDACGTPLPNWRTEAGPEGAHLAELTRPR